MTFTITVQKMQNSLGKKRLRIFCFPGRSPEQIAAFRSFRNQLGWLLIDSPSYT